MEQLVKIREAWVCLEYQHNPEYIQVKKKLRDNRLLIEQLKDENAFETEVLSYKQQALDEKVTKKKYNMVSRRNSTP